MNKIITDDDKKGEQNVKPFHFMASAINLHRILKIVSVKRKDS